eukprot:CAMPEP_0172495844 /NCGR_PEP_ID=MMETSP1066-20121228/78850_1 /TAXON_ID=671091 /ORGANISM="Coscinodiscus wailesii, Strain CCMP2513" /LENGTH=332 /DNA_ID=CAMNT_0013267813 /DNA_START=270 /DNA_END=1268 /DNA_ORIENTATION=-
MGVVYFVLCNDKSWAKPNDPWPFIQPLLNAGADGDSKAKGGAGTVIEKKTIIFVRHGESTWNETFNKGSHRSAMVFAVGFVPNLIKAILYELYLLLSGRMDSWFYDSPLSELGLSQADSLHSFLTSPTTKNTLSSPTEKTLLASLRGEASAPPSLLISSNLRRALSTVAVAFRTRLSENEREKIIVVPSLQEISRNPDTLSLTPAHAVVTPSWIDCESKMCDMKELMAERVDVSMNRGNKPVDTNGLKRMTEFCKYAFEQKDYEVLIVGGHSIWFRSFFRTFLPKVIRHIGKDKKIVNGGTVALTLVRARFPNEDKYVIDPGSVSVIYGGFK